MNGIRIVHVHFIFSVTCLEIRRQLRPDSGVNRGNDSLQVLTAHRLQPARPEGGFDQKGAHFEGHAELVTEVDQLHERLNGYFHTRPHKEAKPVQRAVVALVAPGRDVDDHLERVDGKET